MTDGDGLAAFLLARLDKLKYASDWHARDCQTHRTMPPGSPLGLAGSPLSCNCGAPIYVMYDIEAKRQIIAEHPRYDGDAGPCCGTCGVADNAGSLIGDWPCTTLRLIAEPLARFEAYGYDPKP